MSNQIEYDFYKIANIETLSIGTVEEELRREEYAFEASERFLHSAALLPQNQFIGWEIYADENKSIRISAFSAEDIRVTSEDYNWIFQKCAQVDSKNQTLKSDFFRENRKLYILSYGLGSIETVRNAANYIKEKNRSYDYDRDDSKRYFYDLFNALMEEGAAIRIIAGDTFDGDPARGVILISLPGEMPLRIHAAITLRDRQSKAVNTINLRLSAIRSFLRYCSEEDVALSELYLKVKSIHRFKGKTDPKLEYLNSEQLETVFTAPDTSTRNGRRNQFFMIHAYETGGRVEELVSMTLGDIIRNGNSVQVRLHGKGDKTRYNPLPAEVIPHLDAYLAEFHPDDRKEDYLFYTIHNGKHTKMSPRTVNSFLAVYAKHLHEMDLSFPDHLHCHVFRHSIGMAMYKAGIPISYIKDFLGHSSLDSTAIYAHADNAAMAEALRSVDQEALPKKDDHGNIISVPKKKWKGQEEYLIAFCGLG